MNLPAGNTRHPALRAGRKPAKLGACTVAVVLALAWPAAAQTSKSAAPKGSPATAAPMAPPRTETVEQYDAHLAEAENALRAMEDKPARPMQQVMKKLAKAAAGLKVKRPDGETQSVDSDLWSLDEYNRDGNATRDQVHQARETIALQRRALRVWAGTAEAEKPELGSTAIQEQDSDLARNGPAAAQEIVRQLESTGQIRTGPTRFEQAMFDFWKWVGDSFLKLLDWIGNLFPKSTPNVGAPPSINWGFIKVFFWGVVGTLLLLIAYMVWKAIDGRRFSLGTRRKVRFEGSEDSELLMLPPDELRDRARQLAAEGNFREALRHLYIALLLTLDSSGVWHYDTRRTNWEHIAALRRDPTLRPIVAPLSDLTRRFDRVRYGNAACDNRDWTLFERDVVRLEQSNSVAGAARKTQASP